MERFNFKQFIINAVKAFLIGAGAIAPGVSGSSMAVSFGIYQKVIDIIAQIPKSIIKYFYFLLSLFIGFAIGFLMIALVSKFLDEKGLSLPLFFLFGGLMLGTVPKQFGELKNYKKSNWYYLYAVTTFAIALTLGLVAMLNQETTNNALSENYLLLFLYGAILGFGVVVPGMSGATILILLGVYKLLMEAVADFNFAILIPVAIGMFLAIVFLAKLIRYIAKIYPYSFAYSIFGFVLGTIPIIFLSELINTDLAIKKEIIKLIIAIGVAIIGAILIINFEKLEAKNLDC